MLLGVTAFLSTPAMAAGLVGALGMSALAPGTASPLRAEIVAVAPSAPALAALAPGAPAPATGGGASVGGVAAGVPRPFIGPDPVGGGTSLERLARLDGVALLDQLARLTGAERAEFASRHPDAIAGLVTTPPAAAGVAAWWERTPADTRASLSADLPGVVGNLEGVPYRVRDAANRAFLARTAAGIRAQLDAGVGRAVEDELRNRLEMLSAVEEALRTGPSGARRVLVSLDVEGPGRATIGLGDLATADYVTFFVPGMYVGVAEQLVDWTSYADTSLAEQREWLGRLGLDGEVATVSWIGYHTPTIVNISSLDLAYQGRDALTWSLQGLDAVRTGATPVVAGTVPTPGSDPYVTIVGHSYGSTAAMLALQENDVTVDALVLVGSPGGPAASVAELKVPGGNVWVAAADTDPIPSSGVFGSQPLDADFGAHHFSVRGTIDPITGERLDGIAGHVYYFWPGTTSVRNTALIAIGHGALTTTDDVAVAKAIAR